MFEDELETLGANLLELDQALDSVGSDRRALRSTESQLSLQIAGSGGDRLVAIEAEIGRHERDARGEEVRPIQRAAGRGGNGAGFGGRTIRLHP